MQNAYACEKCWEWAKLDHNALEEIMWLFGALKSE